MYNYGFLLKSGDGIEIDKKETAHYYKMAIDKAHSAAMFNYALIL